MKDRRRCALCDEWYDPNSERAKVHEHPEPQSGPSRSAWFASGLPYERWITETQDGKDWAVQRQNVVNDRAGYRPF